MSQPAPEATIFDLDTPTLAAVLGIDPAMLKPSSLNLFVRDNKVLVEYTLIRAVPVKALGVAFLRASAEPTPPDSQESDGEPEQ